MEPPLAVLCFAAKRLNISPTTSQQKIHAWLREKVTEFKEVPEDEVMNLEVCEKGVHQTTGVKTMRVNPTSQAGVDPTVVKFTGKGKPPKPIEYSCILNADGGSAAEIWCI